MTLSKDDNQTPFNDLNSSSFLLCFIEKDFLFTNECYN